MGEELRHSMTKKPLWLFKISLAFCALLAISMVVHAGPEKKVKTVEPANNAVIKGPFKICMEVEGLTLEPASNGVHEGKGHHHILFSSLPKDLSKPIGRNKAIHMSHGLPCETLNLVPGKHVLTILFSYGDHVPYDPPITDKISITVE